MKLTRRVIYFVAAFVCFGCSSSSNIIPVFKPDDNIYASAYPTRNISEKLSAVQRSVQRIISTAEYRIYFLDDKFIAYNNFHSTDLDSLAKISTRNSQSNAGTAISILQNDRYTVFLTAYHVIESPDTLYSIKEGTITSSKPILQSVSVKTDHDIYIIDEGLLSNLNILAVNKRKDLALLYARNKLEFTAPPLSIATGTAKNLSWGSVIYVLGYPLGNPMVTSGIVSSPNYDNHGTFLTDALFNHGISGGIIIASNDNYNTFEWVGMSSTASVQRQSFLVPRPLKKVFYQDYEAYVDTAYVNKMNFINYGVARATSIESILEFIFKNEEKLNGLGLSAADLSGQ